jgi:hypothetical protein
MSSRWINAFGEVLTLVGILMLFFFGMPYRIRTNGGAVRTTQSTAEGSRLEALYQILGWIGLCCAVGGEAAQVAANFIP